MLKAKRYLEDVIAHKSQASKSPSHVSVVVWDEQLKLKTDIRMAKVVKPLNNLDIWGLIES